MKWSVTDYVAATVVILATLNLGIAGLFGYNILEALTGTGVALRVVESLIGLSGLWMTFTVTRTATSEDRLVAHA